MKETRIMPGTIPAPDTFKLVVTDKGPILVYGKPPLKQQFIMPDSEGISWYFKEGMSYSTDTEPTALCRCGASSHKPYCDGSHVSKAKWDPTLTATNEPILDEVDEYIGSNLTLTDNKKYCAFARFCDAKGRAWNLIDRTNDPTAKEIIIHEANRCPGARLTAWENDSDQPHEHQFKPSLGLIEDPARGISGPLWVRGGIAIKRENGSTYEIRNRVTLCRCGQSSNKPYCDGTHASFGFEDGLPREPNPNGREY